METETPFSSTGKAGVLAVSATFPVVAASDGASGTVERTIVNSPGETANGCPGTGLGVGVGEGTGLGSGVAAATGISLAPVKNERGADDSVVTIGVSR
jgi:hypothetical protein